MEWSLLYQLGIGVATIAGAYWMLRKDVNQQGEEIKRIWKHIKGLEEDQDKKFNEIMQELKEIKEIQIRADEREKMRREMEELKNASQNS